MSVLVGKEARAGGVVARVSIDNQARLNSLSSAVMEAFVAAFAALGEDDSIRAVIVTGAGEKAFVGGADIDEMRGLDEESSRGFITKVHQCCDAVRRCPVPVIARINGFTLGAGLELAAACDLRIAIDGARLGMPEVRLGIPSVVEAALLPRLVGWGRTREILLLGETFSAEEAASWGLIERVAAADEIDDAIDVWLDQLFACEPAAVRAQKALIARWEELPLAAAIDAGVDAFAASFRTKAPARAIDAFRARRRREKGDPEPS